MLITIKELSQILGISRQAVYIKIKKGIIPQEVIHKFPFRINLSKLIEIKPSLQEFLREKNIDINNLRKEIDKKPNINNLMTVKEFAEAIRISVPSVYRQLNKKLWPYIELPSPNRNKSNAKRHTRILINETIKKYPYLKEALSHKE